MSARTAGTCYFKIDGVQFSLLGSCKVDVANIKRDVIENIDGDINFKERTKAGTMELELTTIPGFSAQSLNSITNSTITFEGANGTTYILQSGFQYDGLPVDLDEGKVQAKFAGKIREIPAA